MNGPNRVWKHVICVQNVGAGTGCARIVSSRGTGHTAFDVIGIYLEASDQKLAIRNFPPQDCRKHWYILTLPRLNNSLVSSSKFVLDCAIERP